MHTHEQILICRYCIHILIILPIPTHIIITLYIIEDSKHLLLQFIISFWSIRQPNVGNHLESLKIGFWLNNGENICICKAVLNINLSVRWNLQIFFCPKSFLDWCNWTHYIGAVCLLMENVAWKVHSLLYCNLNREIIIAHLKRTVLYML